MIRASCFDLLPPSLMSSAADTGTGRRAPVVWVTLLVLLVLGAGLWFGVMKPASRQSGTQPAGGPPGGPPGAGGPPGMGGGAATVSTVPVTQGSFSVLIRAVGTVTSYNTVTVLPQVEGRLARVTFQEGQQVKAGQLLAEIDPRSLKAALAEAQGQQAQNRAELLNARRDLARYEQLFKQDSVARQQLDSQRALVRQLEGRGETDQAKVDSARLQLDYTRIEAPVDGRLGLLRVGVGSLIGPSTTDGLVSIIQTDPISVLFSVPEVQLQALREAVSAAGAAGLKVEAWDRSERQRLAVGTVATLDNQIDTTTGSLRVRARFDNPDEALFPNQFVNVRLYLKTLSQALSVPVDTVQFGTQGDYVYVIRDGKAHVQTVRLGATAGDRVEILEGLKAGDQVALEGLDQLRNGRAVKIVESLPGDPDAVLSGAAAEAADGSPLKPAPGNGRAPTGQAPAQPASAQGASQPGSPADRPAPASGQAPARQPEQPSAQSSAPAPAARPAAP